MIDLKLEGVSKRYRIWREPDAGALSPNPLVRKLQTLRLPAQDFWAVKDVSFQVRRGEALGIIGHNGAGKSTILKLLSNITTPTGGTITINGRLSALIEVGSGFHPELTGRENVFLSGSILGMNRREIAAKLDSIVEFAGLRPFLDVPVKRYSSGMYVRLGFSIAAHLDADILLLDEVLAVGDAEFQQKCLRRIDELKRAGTTIVFISHDLSAVEGLCDRVLLMERGRVTASGVPREVIAEYQRGASALAPAGGGGEAGRRQVELRSLTFGDAGGREAPTFRTGGPLTARVEYVAHESVGDLSLGIYFHSLDGADQFQLTTGLDGERINLEPGAGAVEFFCPELGLQPGVYYADIAVEQYRRLEYVDVKYHCTTIRVAPGKIVWGNYYVPHEWRHETAAPPGVGVTADAGHRELTSREAS